MAVVVGGVDSPALGWRMMGEVRFCLFVGSSGVGGYVGFSHPGRERKLVRKKEERLFSTSDWRKLHFNLARSFSPTSIMMKKPSDPDFALRNFTALVAISAMVGFPFASAMSSQTM